MPMVMVIGHIAMNHQIILVVSMRVNLDGFMVTARDVRPDGFAEASDLFEVQISIWTYQLQKPALPSLPFAFLPFMENSPSAVKRSV